MEEIVQLSIKPSLDNLKPLVQSIEKLDIKNVGKIKGVCITKSKVRAYKTDKFKLKKGIKFEITSKSLIKNKVKRLDIIAGKNLVEDKAKKPDGVIGKSLDIFTGNLKCAFKSAEIIESVKALRDAIKSKTIIVKR